MRRVISLFTTLVLCQAASAVPIVDQSQLQSSAPVASFSQRDLAQSFQQSASNISGARVRVFSGASAANITISLYDALPNAGGNLLTSGTTSLSGGPGDALVTWSPVAINSGQTYFLVFESTVANYILAGAGGTPYAAGQAYANSGYLSQPTYDYAFQTYSESTFGVPELGGGSASLPVFLALSVLALLHSRRQYAPKVLAGSP